MQAPVVHFLVTQVEVVPTEVVLVLQQPVIHPLSSQTSRF